MLQNSDDPRLAYVLGVIKTTGMRFPVAEISKKTEFSKGQVSQMLNGKIAVSDAFLEKFNNCFTKVSVATDDERYAELEARVSGLHACVLDLYVRVFGLTPGEAMLRVKKTMQSDHLQPNV